MSDDSAESRTRRLGLGATIMVSFALGGLLLAATMAVGTYLTARRYLIEQRERTATRQAFADAAYVRDGLLTSGAKVSDVLGAVSPPADAAVLVRRGNRWFASSLQVSEKDVPAQLLVGPTDRTVALTWQRTPDGPAVMVAVPLPAVNATFFERTSVAELDSTLTALRIVLAVFAVITSAAAAVLGRWAARRVLAPLDEVAAAAAQIAGGSLEIRLDSTEDPDLATIVASFNSMVDAVNDRIRRDAQFAADVSHELRSPLTALMTSVAVMDGRRADLPQRSQQALDLVKRDLDRFHRALQDLLELGRMETGASGLLLSTVDLSELVRHAADSMNVPPELLHVPPDGARTSVLADKTAVNSAVRNLLENAQRHAGGVASVVVRTEPGHVVISVDDAGSGVPKEDRRRVFERFVRGGSRGALPGAGLGLSLVAETVRAHGGAVWCSEAPGGRGARFTIELPSSLGGDDG